MDWNPLASFGGSLVGSVAGAVGQRRTNKMTAKENQKNRDFAWQQQQESQRFQYSMWKQANEYNEKYNSPAAQMARYQEAGLNPFAALQNQNAIASAGTPSAGTPGAPGSAPYSNPMANVATDLSTGMDAIARFLQQDGIIAQNDKTRAEADAARVSADNAKTDMQLTLALKSLQAGLIKEETFGKIMQNIFDSRTMESRVEAQNQIPVLQRYNMENIESQTHLNQINKAILDKKLPYIDKKERAELAKIQAEVNLAYQGILESRSRMEVNHSTVRLNEQQANHIVEKISESRLTQHMQRMNNSEKQQLIEYTVRTARANAVHAENNTAPDNIFQLGYFPYSLGYDNYPQSSYGKDVSLNKQIRYEERNRGGHRAGSYYWKYNH